MPRKNRPARKPDTRKMKLLTEYDDYLGREHIKEWRDRKGNIVYTRHPIERVKP